MAYSINAGISISLDNVNWYSLTDHNRSEISISPTLIESANRMANGKLRKYVIASKKTISTSWSDLPSQSENVVDFGKTSNTVVSSAWLSEFYNANVFLPIYVKITHSKTTKPSTGSTPNDSSFATSLTGSEIIQCYITRFNVKVKKRMYRYDYVDMDIEFTEI